MNEEEALTPPHSVITEQSLIGAVMMDNAAWDKVADKLAAVDFYRREHRLIWEIMTELADDGLPLDLVTIADRLERAGELEDVGGLGYLGEMVNSAVSSENAEHYANSIGELSLQRELIRIGNGLRDGALSRDGRSASELAQEAEQKLVSAFAGADEGGLRHIGAGLGKAVDELEKAAQAHEGLIEKPRRVLTGFADLDGMIGELRPGALCVIAGRPGMGKSTLAANIAENVAIEQGLPVAIFSVEMPEQQLLMRMLASRARVDFKALREGRLADDGWPLVTNAAVRLSNAPIYVDDSATLTPAQMRARVMKAHRQAGPFGLVVVDYLQYMHVPGARAAQRVMEVTRISRSLAALPKEIEAPVIAVSQLNRNAAGRTDKRPVMSDLRDSGSIEQDASLLLFLHREEQYTPDTQDRGIAEVIIGKNRDGPTGTVRLVSALDRMRFENAENREWGRMSA